ncbi:hypothetical protein NCG89_12550 [Spongiibacter taiwanensis]|uniref:hypothetical protein n=1 Tax=Spongiibacter taiwanensis TaxID=1748242 RepID=UPI0020353427|nr:hypothetical protein [Spongiibacter taiwanensis]USA42354.1 hypothetical protein NCG89_12550 [Spongiibacter taiwanensis]
MALKNLDNLVKTNQLKKEPADKDEFEGLVASAKRRLQDARLEGLSDEGRFSLAYGAAHSVSVAAMRWHGYRSDNRYLVFQCLEHTVGLDRVKWRVLDKCHNARNLAEYEGHLEISTQLLRELIDIADEIVRLVESLGPVQS